MISRKREREKGREKEDDEHTYWQTQLDSYRYQKQTDRQSGNHITHMGVRGRVQQAANGWLQPLVTSAAPYRSSSL